jgi:O-antigen/teichoic acid export membrane protein
MAGPIATGAKWAFLASLVSRFAPPLFTIVLARILTPEDFGLLAVAMVVIAFVTLFQDLGLKQALVQRREIDDGLLGMVFRATAAFGLAWFAALFLAAPLFARLYHNPDVVPVLRLLATLFLVAPLGAVPEALLLRGMDFRRLFQADVLPAVVPGLVAIPLALAGLGVWALVWGALAGSLARTIALWSLVPWRPRRRFEAGAWRQLHRFGGWVSLEALLGWTITYIDQAFAGHFLAAAQVGFYRMGVALSLLPATSLAQTLGRVLFPAFSRVQEDRGRFRHGFEKSLRMVALITVPLGVALAAYSDPLVPLLLGARWDPATQVVRLLAVAGILSSLVNIAPPLYQAMGRVDIMPKFFAVRALISVPAYWFSAQRGLFALAATHLVLTLCLAPVNLTIAVRVLGASAGVVLRAVGVPAGLSAAALGVSLLARRGVPDPHTWMALGVALPVFLAVYWLGLRVFCRERHDEFFLLVRGTTQAQS